MVDPRRGAAGQCRDFAARQPIEAEMTWHSLLMTVLAIIVVAGFCAGVVWRLYRGDRENDRRVDMGLQHKDEYRKRNGSG